MTTDRLRTLIRARAEKRRIHGLRLVQYGLGSITDEQLVIQAREEWEAAEGAVQAALAEIESGRAARKQEGQRP